MQLWFRIIKDAKLINDITITNSEDTNRTKKIFSSLDKACEEFHLSNPIWLEYNIKEFKKRKKVRFNQDNFIIPINFDYLEMSVLEED